MFAVIDCGTTMTRIYIVDEDTLKIVASGRRKVGMQRHINYRQQRRFAQRYYGVVLSDS